MRAIRPGLGLVSVVGLALAGCGSTSAQKSVATTPAAVAKKPAAAPAKSTAAAKRAVAPRAAAAAKPPTTPAVKPPVKKLTTPHSVPIPAARAKVGPPKQWSGTSSKALGTIALPRNVVVHWTVSGGQFAMADGTGKLAISGTGTTGQSFAASGTYAAVKVTANGRWTLTMASLGA